MNNIHLYQDKERNLACSYDTPREGHLLTVQVTDEVLEEIKNDTLSQVRGLLSTLMDAQVAQTLPKSWVNHLGGIETRGRENTPEKSPENGSL